MAISPFEITQDDLKDSSLANLNVVIRNMTDEINRLAGNRGPITLNSHIDMAGNRIANIGSPQEAYDAVNQTVGNSNYGPAAVATQLDSLGNNFFNTFRRLNDNNQRENSSTFLNGTMS